jgi:hypothetical protein
VATVEYVGLDEIPAARATLGTCIREAMEYLVAAQGRQQALKITLGPDERRATVVRRYRLAATRLNVVLRFGGSTPRTYVNANGRQERETSVLYVAVDSTETPQLVAPIAPATLPVPDPLVTQRERKAVQQAASQRPTPPVAVSVPSEDPVAARRHREAAELRAERQQEMDALLNRRPGLKPSTGTKGVWERP